MKSVSKSLRFDLRKHRLKNTTISGNECLPWNQIFEEWPKAEINEWGNRTYEFLPNFEELDSFMKFSGHVTEADC